VRKYNTLRKKTGDGFTLIELLVVIAIIGILSSVVLASLNTAREKSRDVRRVADLNSLALSLELYFDAKNEYPDDLNKLSPDYISAVPKDPSDVSYLYSAPDALKSYHLGTKLENVDNMPQGDADCNSDSAAGALVCFSVAPVAGGFAGDDPAGAANDITYDRQN
jgi:prepilin-type N-terminal cleavage/methylation domain-containing protein